jgi:hypothetical protein
MKNKSKKQKGRRPMNRPHSNSGARSSLNGPATNSRVWNNINGVMPMYNNTLRRDNSVHNFIQEVDLGNVFTSSTAMQVGYARSFKFNDLTQYTSYTSIFDQYRFVDIEVWLLPGLSTSALQSGVSGNLYSATDYDDDNTPTSSTQFQQYTNSIQTPLNMGHYRRWKPHVAQALYGASLFTQFGNLTAPWIDSGSVAVAHYGFKALTAGAASSGTVVSFQLIARIHFQCRNVF